MGLRPKPRLGRSRGPYAPLRSLAGALCAPHNPAPRGRRLFRVAIRRGWAKRCPHCGLGPLYAGWIRLLPRCPVCGLVYERNPGDTWLFINVGDRIFIGLWIAIIYFGVPRTHPMLAVLLFLVVGGALVWTTPNRWGVGTALHYVSRAYSKDVDDPIPDDAEPRE